MVTTSYPRFPGDFAGIFVKRVCNAISAKGVDVTVVAPNDDKSMEYEKSGNVTIHRFNYFIKRYQKIAYGYGGVVVNLKRNKLLYLILPLFITAFLIKIIRLAREADVIHANWIINGYMCALAGIITGTPVILTLRGEDVNQHKKSFVSRLISGILFRRIKMFTAVSGDFCGFLKDTGLPDEKVAFVPNGVEAKEPAPDDLSRFRRENCIDSGRTNILFVGSLIKRKGVEYLLRAMKRLGSDRVTLFIAGEGELKDELIAMAGELNIDDRVVFAGYQHNDTIPLWLASVDIFVLPSLSEGRPNVVLEALAHGVPVIATNIPGTSELIRDGENGLLCDPMDDLSLCEKLQILAGDEKLRSALSAGAKRFIVDEGLTWGNCADKYIRLYEKIVGG